MENARFGFVDDKDLDKIVGEVYTAWLDWRKSSVQRRKELLINLGKRLLDNKQSHALVITSEMGKTITQSMAEVEKCANLCYYYADNIEYFSCVKERKSSAGDSMILYEPQGIILGIMPWNFPYWQAMRFIIPVIAGGNAVLLKHSSNVPLSALRLEALFPESGFPENVCRNLFANYSQMEKVISMKEIRGVSVTGSNSAGMKIAGIAGRYLKKCVLELGGNDPFIVFPDANIENAAEAAVYSRFQNCGQSCIAAKRLFVHTDIFDRFLEIFMSRIESKIVGDPYETDTFMGPLINEGALLEIEGIVSDALAIGARLLTGGKRLDMQRPLYSPTVLADVPDSSPLMHSEVFGPVVPVTAFSDDNEIIVMANNTSFGLGASVWTSDMDKAYRITRELDTGTVAVNGFVRSDPSLPFGGVKDSGFGRELSVEGFREFLNIKTMTIFR